MTNSTKALRAAHDLAHLSGGNSGLGSGTSAAHGLSRADEESSPANRGRVLLLSQRLDLNRRFARELSPAEIRRPRTTSNTRRCDGLGPYGREFRPSGCGRTRRPKRLLFPQASPVVLDRALRRQMPDRPHGRRSAGVPPGFRLVHRGGPSWYGRAGQIARRVPPAAGPTGNYLQTTIVRAPPRIDP